LHQQGLAIPATLGAGLAVLALPATLGVGLAIPATLEADLGIPATLEGDLAILATLEADLAILATLGMREGTNAGREAIAGIAGDITAGSKPKAK
jgi:hypothetical protein